MKIIQHESIPHPAGHYSPVVEHNGTLYISGQLPRDAAGNIPEGISDQTQMVLSKLDTLLLASGSDRNHVLQVRIYIPDVGYWGRVNEAYCAYFGNHKPARCIVPSRDLHYGCSIELEAVACLVES